MRQLVLYCLLFCLLPACKKDSGARVDIYMLSSFTQTIKTVDNLPYVEISNAVLANTPLVMDKDIDYYTPSSCTFKLRKDIKPVIGNFSSDKGFAVTVNGQPVYYGRFHPLYLSSITLGLATIDPVFFHNNELEMRFESVSGSSTIMLMDKRNDKQLTNALKATGRLR